jgi:hypothetical protein
MIGFLPLALLKTLFPLLELVVVVEYVPVVSVFLE